ncbi:ACP phosphodiesterase [Nonlabens dokdonensis]|uniref:ACP phosphodiesterase n=1 Tax=Nonlabens dokdonensis TaxID=328515 RepID=A0A1Z8AP47_9FLAO|nr:acyl carrier protein phosphodiesterase [Nonlabens dokdonensis]OUS12145.1 ACP phosphodiesterase [Nonlabens dokdonensis]
MNYLAHIYLSNNDKELRIGNFIADSVRGKDFTMFPNRVAQGIVLHRHIDTFTDKHSIVRKSKDRIREKYGHWSGVIVDIYYDHFLAANWNTYHSVPLKSYVQSFYNDLKEYHDILPKRVQSFLPIMIEQNWLKSYETIEGISTIFEQMNRRTKGKGNMDNAPVDLIKSYDALENDFHAFMSELELYVSIKITELS